MSQADEKSITEALNLVTRAASLLDPMQLQAPHGGVESLRVAQAVAFTLVDQLTSLLPPSLRSGNGLEAA